MKKIVLSLFALFTVLVSCKKDDSPKSCDLNAANLAGTYKLTAFTYKADTATPPVDEYATLDACEKDDQLVFNTNNTYNYNDNGVVCSPSGNSNGIWSLSGNSLTTDFDVYTVTSFNCSGMTITMAGTTAGELTTLTFAKQ